jgi:WXG100 family type VII secretion target
MSSPIVYDFAGIDSMAGQIESFVADMNGTLGDVDAKFRTLLANEWTGAAADAFGVQSSIWHKKADEIAASLRRLASAAGTASINMQQADSAAAARFQ